MNAPWPADWQEKSRSFQAAQPAWAAHRRCSSLPRVPAVGVIDRNEEAGQAVVAEINKSGGKAVFAAADVADEAQVNAAVASVTSAIGPANVLFNHAGTIIIKPFLDMTLVEWEWLMGVNVTSMYLMTKAVLPGMLARAADPSSAHRRSRPLPQRH